MSPEATELKPGGGAIEFPPVPRVSRRPMHPVRRFVRGLAWAFYGIAIPIVLLPGLLLLIRAETAAGHLFGLGVLALFAIPPTLVCARFVHRTKGRYPVRVVLPIVATPAAVFAVLCVLAPTGESIPGTGVASHYAGASRFRRFSCWNLLPEIDQIKLGVEMMPFFSPIDRRVPPSLMDITMAVYRPMEADPAFRSLGSALDIGYAEWIGDRPAAGHFYEYVPRHPPDERLGLLIFLHGSIGNFKGYLWAWKAFADRQRVAVVCPTFGVGNWYRTGAVEAVEQVRDYALNNLPIDGNRIILVGLSSGGIGITLAGAAHPDHFTGLVFLSGVQKEKFVFSPEFLNGQRDRPVLVIHGRKDPLVLFNDIHEGTVEMSRAGILVTEKAYAEEDHYLFFGSTEAVYADIAEWMRGVELKAH